MTNAIPTLGEVELEWRPAQLRAAATAMSAANDEFTDLIEQTVTQIRDAGATWDGDAYLAAYDRIAGDRDNARRVADAVNELAGVLTTHSESVASYRSVVLAAVAAAREAGFDVRNDWSVEAPASDSADAQQRSVHQVAINSALADLLVVVSDASVAIEEAAKDVRADGDNLGDGDDPTVGHSAEEARTAAASVAFETIFGRKPACPNDWATANALNPGTYDPKYSGVSSEIRVARITPVHGQGVVRAAQYISRAEVLGAPQDLDDVVGPFDLGDDRTEDPTFDPEHARVATYVDYENGIVIVRQNPSVTSDGEVEVAAPNAEVWQVADGSVRIQYDAKNPFAPGFDSIHTVNGDLVFTPGPDGVRVDGTRTDYPSLEAYQDFPDGETRTVAIDPAASGRLWGPIFELPGHHDIGIGSIATEPFKTYPWSGGDLLPPQDLPSTSVGSVAAPPRVEVVRPTYSSERPTI